MSPEAPTIGNPLLLIAELTYTCPLHCPYCSNPVSISDGRYRNELSTEDWSRVFCQAAKLGALQVALVELLPGEIAFDAGLGRAGQKGLRIGREPGRDGGRHAGHQQKQQPTTH